MQPIASSLRDAFATRSADVTPAASLAAAVDPGTHSKSLATDARSQAGGGMSASLLDSLPQSKLDALLPTARQSGQSVSAAQPDGDFKIRELTLPFGALASAVPKAPSNALEIPTDKFGGERFADVGNTGDFLGIGGPGFRLPDGFGPNGHGSGPRDDFGGGLDGLGQPADLGGRGIKLPGGGIPGGDRLGGFDKIGDLLGGGGSGFKVPGGGPNGPGVDPRANYDELDNLGQQVGLGGKGIKLPGGIVPGGDPDLNPRADWGDGDGDGTGKLPGKPGPKGGGGGDPIGAGGLGIGGFHAFDIDIIVPHYHDPDLNPRADCGESGCGTTSGHTDCGGTGCGTTSGHTDCGGTGCGTTSGHTDCGGTGCGTTSGHTDCGGTGCGTTSGHTDCGGTGCGTTSGHTDCGSTSCGGTDACGSTSGSINIFDRVSRVELLRDQLATQLKAINVKQAP